MSILSKLGKLFKKLWDAIRRILAIILIVIAVVLVVWAAIFSGGAALVLFGFAISQTAAFVLGALALTGAFLIDAETSKEVTGKIGGALGDAAEATAGIVGDVAGGVASGLLGSTGGLLIVGLVAAYFLLSGSKESKTRESQAGRDSAAKKPIDSKPAATREGIVTDQKKEDDYYGSIPLLA